MSHLKERVEKNCLNCQAEVQGKFCHICGQENNEPVETAWHLIAHFFNDITHFDGKFFSTVKYLVLKPGFLSREYKAGRRASYLNPVRMYVFTSAIFFLIFFSLNHGNKGIVQTTFNNKTLAEIDRMDSANFSDFTRMINDDKPMSRLEFAHYTDTVYKRGVHFTGEHYKSKAEYDSLLKSGARHHNWLKRQLIYKEIEMDKKYNNDQREIVEVFKTNLMHSFPQMLFISLPLFALVLKILYSRRKEFYYASHAIFSIQFYVFVFIMLLLVIGLKQLEEVLPWSLFGYLTGFIFIFIFFYEYKAMRNFYQQRRAKTIFKFILLNMMMSFIITILFIVFTLTSLLKI